MGPIFLYANKLEVEKELRKCIENAAPHSLAFVSLLSKQKLLNNV
tara:strand:+ start:152 stop:286 length:135 start_codon:yes stop_codon:yes gene_type:complete